MDEKKISMPFEIRIAHHRAEVNSRGFTLIELLVVISIIALLVSILLPALAGARAQARTTLCASRHREIYMAWMFYAEDHDGHIMPSWHGWSTEDIHGGWWVYLIPPYIANLTFRADYSLPDALWPKTMFCPERYGPIAKLDGGGQDPVGGGGRRSAARVDPGHPLLCRRRLAPGRRRGGGL